MLKDIKKIEKRGRVTQDQRQRESGTFVKDVQTLRKRVGQYEKHIKKLKVLVDKEDTENLIKALDAQKDLPDLDLIQQEITQVSRQIAAAKKQTI